MKRSLTLSAAAMTAALALTACGTSPGSTGSSSALSSTPAPSSAPAGSSSVAAAHTAADAMFAQMMIPHHQQAVEMSDVLLGKDGVDPRVRTLAEKIKAEQAPEIETMRGWLTAWGEATSAGSGHAMHGMMNDEDMVQLRAASGTDAGKLFLTQMIRHHEGAIAMARDEADHGSDPDAVALARSVVSSQQAEVTQMKDLLAPL